MAMKESQLAYSRIIYNMKAVAVFSIVTAHCYSVPATFSAANQYIAEALKAFSIIGVPVFFILSGYLFHPEKQTFNTLLLKKAKSLGIPWLFCGTAVYLYIVLRKGYRSYIGWLLGDGTYLYFMTMLVCCFCIFFFVRKTKWITLLAIACVVASLLGATYFKQLPFSAALNVFDWIPYFACGRLCCNYQCFDTICNTTKRHLPIILSVFAIMLLIRAWAGVQDVTAIDAIARVWSVAFFAISILFVVGMGVIFNNDLVEKLGRYSFSIYLLHMPIAGIVASLFNRFDAPLTTLIRPLIVLFVSYGCIRVYEAICSHMPLGNRLKMLIGLR